MGSGPGRWQGDRTGGRPGPDPLTLSEYAKQCYLLS